MIKERGMKLDDQKDRWDLLPIETVVDIVRVLMYGCKKYGPWNWMHVLEPRRRYYAATMRHLAAYASGEEIDEESGLPHLAHAATCLVFLLAAKRFTDQSEKEKEPDM